MGLENKTIGFAFTGSFCMINNILPIVDKLCSLGINVIPILSENAASIDTRFINHNDLIDILKKSTGNEVLKSIKETEPIGPKELLDMLLIAPCTGNTLAKIANGVTDSSVTMAFKAHMRNLKPVVIFISTNDALGTNMENIGKLIIRKNVYFVPFFQDNSKTKPNSLLSKVDSIESTISHAFDGIQIQPVLLGEQ